MTFELSPKVEYEGDVRRRSFPEYESPDDGAYVYPPEGARPVFVLNMYQYQNPGLEWW